MYVYPLLLPFFSNREDLQFTVSVFDDDTGDAIELSGRTLATPGDFTGSSWTVTDGAIVTSSNTQLTIPDFPIGNQLEAVAATVGVNLGILPGDSITFADPTGKNTMTGYVTSYTAATGAIVFQVGMTFQFEIRAHSNSCDDYDLSLGGTFGAGVSIDQPIVSASLGSGLSIVDVGVIQVNIPEVTMRRLHHRTYKASMTTTDSVNTRQLFVGKLPMQAGGVSQ